MQVKQLTTLVPLSTYAPVASAEASAEQITLISSEGEKFSVPKKVAQLSELVKNMTEEGASWRASSWCCCLSPRGCTT